MTITAALVLYSVLWFLTFLMVIPVRLKTQGDMGEVVPGTHASSPERHDLKKKAWITTALASVMWGIIATIILTGAITIADIEAFTDMFRPAQ